MSNQYDDFISIKIIGLEEALAKIGAIPSAIDQAVHNNKTLSEIGTVLRASAITTIDVGGRPDRYKPLAQSTIDRRAKNRKGSTKPLIYLGTMRQSLDTEVSGGELYLTSVGYLKYHQFKTNRVKARFPARPVWGVQADDHEEITAIIVDSVAEQLTKK